MTPGDPFDRVTQKPRPNHPPCPPDEDGIEGCWAPAGEGWRETRAHRECCQFDKETALWTRCVPREEAKP